MAIFRIGNYGGHLCFTNTSSFFLIRKYIKNQKNVVGETSSGKSTLINKILKKNIFKGSTNESTATICKLRNSEKITIKVEDKNKKVEELDISEDDLETQEGISNLSKELTKYTENSEFNCVDIGLPLPFLKVNKFKIY